jgi:hypothetical protein
MRGKEPQQFAADIARGSEDRCSNHGRRRYVPVCIYMQVCA